MKLRAWGLLLLPIALACRPEERVEASSARVTPSETRAVADAPPEPASGCGDKTPKRCKDEAEALETTWGFDLEAQAKLYERGCEYGDADACAALAVRFQDGRGRPHDDARARELYEQACEQGSGVGCFNLALMYRGGNGVELDATKADEFLKRSVPLYQSACDAGALEWCMNLGFVYEHGYLGQPELARAESIYQKACEGGHADSCTNLSLLQLDASKDTPAALARLEQGCEGGGALACGVLGHVYLRPDPAVTRDAAKAAGLLERACELGDRRGCSLYAGMLSLGDDLPADSAKADRFYERGCRLGSSDACFLGGLRYSRDQPEQAITWFERSCQIGHADACGQLGAHYQAGLGVPKDDARAEALYVDSCRLGQPGSCVELLRRGRKLPLPPQELASFLAEGCRRGIPEACSAQDKAP